MLSGEDRENQCCCASPTPSCLPKAPSLESGLTCLLSVPDSLPPGAHAALGARGAPWAAAHTRGMFSGPFEAAPARASLFLNQCCSLKRGKKAFFHEPTVPQAAAHAVPTPARGASPSIHPFPRGHKVMETQQLPVLPVALGWELTSLPRALPSSALAASTPPGSLRSLCSISFPAWSCCQTSHCDTVPEAELAPLVSQTVPNPCG